MGDWKYQNQAFSRTYNEDRELLEESSSDVDGGDVGDAAQFTAGIGRTVRNGDSTFSISVCLCVHP
jgi:hypothetical protein